jgi:hypothetical protein
MTKRQDIEGNNFESLGDCASRRLRPERFDEDLGKALSGRSTGAHEGRRESSKFRPLAQAAGSRPVFRSPPSA